MDFGASTLFLRERSVLETLNVISRAGYAAAEVWIDHLRWTSEMPTEIARYARLLGLELSVHAAMYDLNLTSSNVDIRTESLRQIEASIRMTAELGARVVVVHPGRLSSSRDNPEAVWACLVEVVQQIDEWATAYGVVVGLEMMERRHKEIFVTPEDAGRLMAHNWRSVGLTVDIAHLNTFGDPVKLLDAIDPDWIAHVHLSDNADHTTHLPLGWGEVDLSGALAALHTGYDGLVNLEGYVSGRGEEVLHANLNYLRHLGYAHAPARRQPGQLVFA